MAQETFQKFIEQGILVFFMFIVICVLAYALKTLYADHKSLSEKAHEVIVANTQAVTSLTEVVKERRK